MVRWALRRKAWLLVGLLVAAVATFGATAWAAAAGDRAVVTQTSCRWRERHDGSWRLTISGRLQNTAGRQALYAVAPFYRVREADESSAGLVFIQVPALVSRRWAVDVLPRGARPGAPIESCRASVPRASFVTRLAHIWHVHVAEDDD